MPAADLFDSEARCARFAGVAVLRNCSFAPISARVLRGRGSGLGGGSGSAAAAF